MKGVPCITDVVSVLKIKKGVIFSSSQFLSVCVLWQCELVGHKTNNTDSK